MFNRCSKCNERSVKKAGDVCTVCAPSVASPAPQTSATDPSSRAARFVAADPPAPAPTHKLGDKVAAVAKALGIEQKPGCGCAERQKAMNEAKSLGDVARAIFTK